jgi:hypothetical protein
MLAIPVQAEKWVWGQPGLHKTLKLMGTCKQIPKFISLQSHTRALFTNSNHLCRPHDLWSLSPWFSKRATLWAPLPVPHWLKWLQAKNQGSWGVPLMCFHSFRNHSPIQSLKTIISHSFSNLRVVYNKTSLLPFIPQWARNGISLFGCIKSICPKWNGPECYIV